MKEKREKENTLSHFFSSSGSQSLTEGFFSLFFFAYLSAVPVNLLLLGKFCILPCSFPKMFQIRYNAPTYGRIPSPR
jgi:hypothetical protein